MPIRPQKKPAWKLEQERAQTIAGMRSTRAGARRAQIAEDEEKARAEAERRQRSAGEQSPILSAGVSEDDSLFLKHWDAMNHEYGFDAEFNTAYKAARAAWFAALASAPAAPDSPTAEKASGLSQAEAHALAVSAGFACDYDAHRGVHHYSGFIEQVEKLIAQADRPPAVMAECLSKQGDTDMAKRLRQIAEDQMWANHCEINKATLLAAADECDRFYTGMMAWKQTAEKKDADWNRERMERVNERCAARATAMGAGTLASMSADAQSKGEQQ